MMKTRTLRLAGHVLRQGEVRPANVAMNWTLDDRKDQEKDHERLGVRCLANIYKAWV